MWLDDHVGRQKDRPSTRRGAIHARRGRQRLSKSVVAQCSPPAPPVRVRIGWATEDLVTLGDGLHRNRVRLTKMPGHLKAVLIEVG